jgi:DNA ligase (NAD+)
VAARKLDFAVWGVLGSEAKTHEEEHKLAREMGFRVEAHTKLCKNLKEVETFLTEWEEKRKKLAYQTDGAVININDSKLREALGFVGKAPRGSVAWKYSAEQGTTKIIDIRVSVGRTGALTPFAVMEPVKLAGTTVTRATLHNEDEINRKDIRIGDTVIVQKAGDIIPEVVEALPNLRTGKERKFVMPKECPVCGGPVVKPAGEAVARCAAKNCFAIEQQKVGHFVSRDAFNIEGLGEKIIEQLFAEGLITDAADIFKLTVGDIQPLERFAEKSAANLIDSIKEHKKVPLNRFIYALGIRFVGSVTANDLANYFGNYEHLKKATYEELEQIEGIGPVAAMSIFEWYKDKTNIKFLEKLFEGGVEIEKPKRVGDKLAGLTFVVTGTLEGMSRDEAEQMIREAGGKATSSVSASTSYLVVGDNPGSKLAKAEKFGVKQISEEDLQNLLK